jgi:hypothetical protein
MSVTAATQPRAFGHLKAAIGQGPHPRAAHEPIRIALPDLVERRSASGDQRGPDRGVSDEREGDALRRRQIHAGDGRHQDQEVQSRLGEGAVVEPPVRWRHTIRGTRHPPDVRRLCVSLHARAPVPPAGAGPSGGAGR